MQLIRDEMPAASAWITLIKQESRNPSAVSRNVSCSQRKTHHLQMLPDGRVAVWSSHAGALGEHYHVYPVLQAKLSLLLRLGFSARRGQGEFLWGKNGKCLCPWIVSGSAWVFLHALRAWIRKILRHKCNQKWRPIKSCRDRHFQPQQDPNSFPLSFKFYVIQATKIAFILTNVAAELNSLWSIAGPTPHEEKYP